MTGKTVRLVTEGEATEVDKTVVERLADPLTHMIRNAIDHGLETPEKRIAAGKPAEGVVRLSALHRSGRIVIEVADDGGGINRATRQSDRDRAGLISPDAILSRRRNRQPDLPPRLLDRGDDLRHFRPRRRHGRGEAVRAAARRPDFHRVPARARARTFTLSLPLTLAVLGRHGGERRRSDRSSSRSRPSSRPCSRKRSDVHELCGDARVIAIRDKFLPFIDVGQALGYSRPSHRGRDRRGTSRRERERGPRCTSGRCDPGPAPGRHQELGGQLRPGSRHRRRDGSRRWARGTHSRRERNFLCRARRRCAHRTSFEHGGLMMSELEGLSGINRRMLICLPYRRARVLRRYHGRSGDPRVDGGNRASTSPQLCPGPDQLARCGAADRRPGCPVRLASRPPQRRET